MATVRAKRLEFAVELDRAGRLSAEGRAPQRLPAGLTPEHLVLAGLVRCSLTSLDYHARRASLELTVTGASASGLITKRAEDSRYAFVEIECRLDVHLAPRPDEDELTALIAKAERDCFVGASLTAAPSYTWTVNGEEIS